MLVLSRKLNQNVVIGDVVTVKVLGVKGNTVKLGIEAPKNVRILRGELPVTEEDAPITEATITVVHSDPASETYSVEEPATIPLPAVEENVGAVEQSQGTNRLRNIVKQVNDRIALTENVVMD